jgi:hypothetical protein
MKILITIIMTFMGSNVLDSHGINLPNMQVSSVAFYKLERQADLLGRQLQLSGYRLTHRFDSITRAVENGMR